MELVTTTLERNMETNTHVWILLIGEFDDIFSMFLYEEFTRRILRKRDIFDGARLKSKKQSRLRCNRC